jgi:hypothetical protein
MEPEQPAAPVEAAAPLQRPADIPAAPHAVPSKGGRVGRFLAASTPHITTAAPAAAATAAKKPAKRARGKAAQATEDVAYEVAASVRWFVGRTLAALLCVRERGTGERD